MRAQIPKEPRALIDIPGKLYYPILVGTEDYPRW